MKERRNQFNSPTSFYASSDRQFPAWCGNPLSFEFASRLCKNSSLDEFVSVRSFLLTLVAPSENFG
jgi:hypothetical protein